MAVEKGLNTPKGPLVSKDEETQLDSPFMVSEFDDGSIEFDFDPLESDNLLSESVPNITKEHYENLIEDYDDEDHLNEIGLDVVERFEADKMSRKEWMQTVTDGLALLGTRVEEIDDPFPGACAAHHPLILESAVKFQAKASSALFSSKGPVKTAVLGEPTEEKEDQAKRVRNHMNYQIMYQMDEFFDETEQMLFYLPIVGSSFKKLYYDAVLDRPTSVFIPVDQFVVNYHATSLATASCFTHAIKKEGGSLKKDIKAGLYKDVELTVYSNIEYDEFTVEIDEIMGYYDGPTDDEVYTILEQYVNLHLPELDSEHDEDEIPLPYVISVELESKRILSIRRNWKETDDLQKTIIPFTHYKFVPGMGFYGLGFIHLLGNLQMTLTSTMRSLVDSGMFANLQGGFVDKRLRIKADGPIAPGEFRNIESGGLDIKNAIVPLQFKEPSSVLLQMYQFIEERAQRFADSTEQVVADSSNYGPVGTTMALLEASTKFFSGIHKRIHKAQKQEFRILAAINFEYLEESETFKAIGKTFEVSKQDYDGTIDVVPVSDPNMSSQSQKITQAQAIYTAALQNPAIHDLREVSKYYYDGIGIDDDYVDKFLPKPEEPAESDPMTDLINAQQSKPIKAFPGQDHESHVAVKTAFLQDPTAGADPMMQNLVPIIQANIQEHQMLKFKEDTLGAVAGDQSGAPPEAVIAQAAQQVSQQNQRIQELEAIGPDEARSRLADAEVSRVQNESLKLQADIKDQQVQRNLDAVKLELDKYREDNKLLIAQMQETNKQAQVQMKEMSSILKEAEKIKQATMLKTEKTVDKS